MSISSLEQMASAIQRRLRDDWDYPLAIGGKEGVGKSTLAIQLAKAVDPTFTVKERLAYITEEIIPKIKATPRYGAIIIDEGTSALFKREAMKPENKNVIKILSMCRAKNLFVIVCTTRLGDVDIVIREHRLAGYLHIVKRGKVIYYKKDAEVMLGDPWYLENTRENKKMRRRLRRGRFTFSDLNKEDKNEYMKIKLSALDNAIDEALNNKDNGQGKRGRPLGRPPEKVGKDYIKIREETGMTQMQLALVIEEDRTVIAGYEALAKTKMLLLK